MSPRTQARLSVDEYLALERETETRHEFLAGEVFAMGGASLRHTLVNSNLVAALHRHLRGRGCSVVSNDLRVRVPATDLFTYPDVVVFCGDAELDEGDLDTLLNPLLIVEVLSGSTEDYDRGTKFAHYRTIDSLLEYVLVDPRRRHVERYVRRAKNRWELWENESDDEVLELESVDCQLPLAEIYDSVPGL